MVMDVQPSPQSVGREFVRQYYTLLNKAPDHLHRFYNNSSSFLHEGLDANNRDAQMVVGQKQIHNKILQLNFRDCHAKISQVDSQATLGNGVVVQVTGELSNGGQPMRRFTQTFVLASQSPKKYYVHNDIFRYQDYYTEDEVEENGRSDAEEEPVTESSVGVDAQQSSSQTAASQAVYYQSNVVSTVPSNNIYTHQVAPLNGMHTSASIDDSSLSSVQSPPQASDSATSIENNVEAKSLDIEESVKNLDIGETYEDDRSDTHHLPNEPKTYANLVKSGGQVSGSFGAPSASPPPPAVPKFNPPELNRFANDPPLGAPNQKPLAQRPLRERRTSNSNSQNVQQSQSSQQQPHQILQGQQQNSQQPLGDSHQLFLGNIPHHATEEELRNLFNRFGTVADLRILSKQGQKIPGQRPPPNYGFITYEDSASVQECLTNLPIFFPDNSPDGQKLNVEEKKTRTRAPGESGGRIGGGNNFGMSNNGPRSMSGLQQNRNNGPNNGGGPGMTTRGAQPRQPFNPNRGGSFNRSDRNDRMGGGGGGNTFVNNRR